MLESIEHKIWHWASLLPDKTAVKSGKKSATYLQLCQRVLGARDYFVSQLMLNAGDTIVLAAGKQIEFVYAYFGAHLAGLKVVPVDPATNPDRMAFIIKQTGASLLVGFDGIENNIRTIGLKEFEELASEFSVPSFPEGSQIADILFTTGTTGKPKGVPLTYDNEAAAARNINDFIGNTRNDIELLALPVSHSFGLGRMRCCLSQGATLILLGSFANVKKLFRTIEEEHVTGFTMVPASWRYLKN